ncbi:hypothetical protein [Mesorhizobium sp. WSM3859]|uniref:hypothetical protein n=1 Tax=Mesorhizobium sp. WSM3859 TaxID=2029402 RepID=UPI001FE0B7DD|nr:hypothetical protein [Mesorhizobium sp. WSM3859]
MGDTPISSIPESRREPRVSAWDAIRSAFVSEGAIGDEFADIMIEIEAERKRDFDGLTGNS